MRRLGEFNMLVVALICVQQTSEAREFTMEINILISRFWPERRSRRKNNNNNNFEHTSNDIHIGDLNLNKLTISNVFNVNFRRHCRQRRCHTAAVAVSYSFIMSLSALQEREKKQRLI